MRLLAYTSPARGHLYPLVPILTELISRGHRADLCTLSSGLDQLTTLGIGVQPIDPAIEAIEIEDWRKRSLLGATKSVMRTFGARARLEGPDLARAIERDDPDGLLIDVNCWGAAAIAEASGKPWAIYSPYLLPLASRDAPPFGLGLRPRKDRLGAIRDSLVRPFASATFDRMAMPSINRLRARQGLARLASYDELLARVPLLLALTAEGFEYPRSDWPANVRLVGAINWAPAQVAPSWLDELGDPLVLVTCSTERQRDERLIPAALEGLPAEGIAVIATSAAHDPSAFRAPPGSRVVRFLAHDPVLQRAACVVCHGGMGIVQKALAAGVPLVVVPAGRDQLETARRVEVAGAGVRLSPRRLTPQGLASAVRTAIELRAGAERVSRAFASAGGARAAADAIESIASGG
ncbi:MAG TPA: nucleotide disphospho-sugar-binding domain-containing protein [Solirubrobacteraceae bacterium]|jgi:MGT family glycosyltransferase|nr:nucleotide disphospho-sugar-binding domain-containing protein [Solirubrobacteraceae bacterium]